MAPAASASRMPAATGHIWEGPAQASLKGRCPTECRMLSKASCKLCNFCAPCLQPLSGFRGGLGESPGKFPQLEPAGIHGCLPTESSQDHCVLCVLISSVFVWVRMCAECAKERLRETYPADLPQPGDRPNAPGQSRTLSQKCCESFVPRSIGKDTQFSGPWA